MVASCRRPSRSSPTSGRPHRRGTPLGVVGAVQELGSVLGPVLGAVVLAWSGWRAIFWLNVAAALVLYAVIHLLGSRSALVGSRLPGVRSGGAAAGPGPRRSVVAVLAVLGLGVTGLALAAPESLVTDVALGAPFVPFAGESAGADADRRRRARAARRRRRAHGAALVGGAAPRRPRRGAARRRRPRQPRADLRVVRPGEGGRRPARLQPAARRRGRPRRPRLVAPSRRRPAHPARGRRAPAACARSS